jgi:hypothetical protein
VTFRSRSRSRNRFFVGRAFRRKGASHESRDDPLRLLHLQNREAFFLLLARAFRRFVVRLLLGCGTGS